MVPAVCSAGASPPATTDSHHFLDVQRVPAGALEDRRGRASSGADPDRAAIISLDSSGDSGPSSILTIRPVGDLFVGPGQPASARSYPSAWWRRPAARNRAVGLEVPAELQRRMVGPLQIFDPEHRRPDRRGEPQHLHQNVEDALSDDLGLELLDPGFPVAEWTSSRRGTE